MNGQGNQVRILDGTAAVCAESADPLAKASHWETEKAGGRRWKAMLFVCASQKTYKKGMAEQAMSLSVQMHRKAAVAEKNLPQPFCASDSILIYQIRRRWNMKTWTQKEKHILLTAVLAASLLAWGKEARAMHIMEGYLPAGYCVAWGAVCLPFLAAGFFRIRRLVEEQKKALILLAMSGAFIFVISSLKIPSVTGSCSHMTGTGLGAILFGPSTVSILGVIVLLFQAVMLAHGGLTTLGANAFSMAVAGPLVSFGIYRLGMYGRWNRKMTIFLAAFFGDMVTYCVTSLQLAIAYPGMDSSVAASAVKFLGVFAPTQLPLAVLEGILTVLVVLGMESFAAPELRAVGYWRKERTDGR